MPLEGKVPALCAGTPAQSAALDVHRRALAAWWTIPYMDKEKWHGIAKNVPPRRPPFGIGGHITGHNLFVSAYHGFHTLGNEHVPEPVEFSPFPVFVADFVSAETVNTSDIRITLKLAMLIADNSARYALFAKVQLTEAGKRCSPGKMRNFLAEDIPELSGIVEERIVAVTISDYATFAGMLGGRYTLHIRYVLIDRTIGYRSLHRQLSVILKRDITEGF